MAKYQLLKDEEGTINRAIIKEGNTADPAD